MRLKQLVPFCLMALLSLVASRPAFAQSGTVTGTITSAETGAPLVAAVVQLTRAGGTNAGSAVTNQSGRFVIDGVPAGTYTLVVSSTGYDAGRVETLTVGAGQTATTNMALPSRTIDLDPIVVSASRQTERALDAPARVEVVTEQEIEVRPAISAADHVRALPGVDVATSGIQSTNVVARGFNNAFSGSLYMLSDHRIAGVPSLRVNLLNFVPQTNEDLERIEVVLGPGSALYGPNTANGVLHMLSKSPLTSQGTTFSLTGGEKSLFQGSFRTAHLLGENLGVKLSGQYLQADEWVYTDPVEASERTAYQTGPRAAALRAQLIAATGLPAAEVDARIGRIGNRDYDVQRWSGEFRADWRVTQDLTTIFSAGTNTSNGIELTGLGAGQAKDWRSDYFQLRTNWGRAFGQVYLNQSDAGDTYLLRNGVPITDKSKLYVAQLQHGAEIWGGRQDFTYGVDFLQTNPETGGTINGSYEDEDETTEIGGYIQSETNLSSMFDLVLAGRVDTHSALPEAIFSPRAALVFKPATDQTFRLSYNRAFSTPSSLTQFLDLASPIPSAGAAALGYSLRIQGSGDEGFSFRRADGSYLIRSPFTPQAAGGPATLLPAAAAINFWPAAVQAVAAGSPTPLPAQLVLGDLILVAADAWWSRRENLVTPLTSSTPFVHLDAATTQQYLASALVPFFIASGSSQAVATAQAAGTAAALAPNLASVPLGVISSQDVNATGAQVLVTYLNVDQDLDLYGTDLSVTALVTPTFSLEATGSLVSDDVFTTDNGMRVTLNAPKRKATFAALYANDDSGFNGEARLRYNASYPVDSGVFRATRCLGDTGSEVEECVGDFALVDVNVGYRLPSFPGASLQLSVQNLFDEDYRSFPGVPEIGRLALLRLRYEF